MLVRKATAQDLSSIQNLMNSLNNFRNSNFKDINKPFHKRVTSYPNLTINDLTDWLYFVCESESQLVWFISWSIHKRSNHKLDALWSIDELFVLYEYRWMWIALELSNILISEFKSKGCNHITVHTDFENECAHSFYRKLWMKEVTVEFWWEI